MLAAGQIIDRYEVEEELGAGGMAVVYRVRHRTLGSLHALKVLTVGGTALRERLLAEGRAQGQLQHPNTLNVTDIIDVDGSPGLVMEYIAGGTLEEWLDQERPDREERIEVFRQVVEAMAVAHTQGWIHRDLKPSNVLMDRVADRWMPKVADFGLVKALETPLGKAKTRQGIAMGTPGFMANEQFTDASNVTAAADVFSLGCILVWLITEVIPFQGDTPVQVYQNVAANSRVRLKPTDPLYDLTERCLDPDPSKRPQNAGELLQELGGAPRARSVDFGPLPSRTPAPARREHAAPSPAPSSKSAAPKRPSRSPPEPPSQRHASDASVPDRPVRSGLFGKLFAAAGCGGLGIAGGVVVAVLILAALATPSLRRGHAVNKDICNLNGIGDLGVIEHPGAQAGQLLKLRRGVRVVKQTPSGETSCLLPAGSLVRVGEVRSDGVRVQFDAENQLPFGPRTMRLLFGAPRN